VSLFVISFGKTGFYDDFPLGAGPPRALPRNLFRIAFKNGKQRPKHQAIYNKKLLPI